jgi:hypothetical protein
MDTVTQSDSVRYDFFGFRRDSGKRLDKQWLGVTGKKVSLMG